MSAPSRRALAAVSRRHRAGAARLLGASSGTGARSTTTRAPESRSRWRRAPSSIHALEMTSIRRARGRAVCTFAVPRGRTCARWRATSAGCSGWAAMSRRCGGRARARSRSLRRGRSEILEALAGCPSERRCRWSPSGGRAAPSPAARSSTRRGSRPPAGPARRLGTATGGRRRRVSPPGSAGRPGGGRRTAPGRAGRTLRVFEPSRLTATAKEPSDEQVTLTVELDFLDIPRQLKRQRRNVNVPRSRTQIGSRAEIRPETG